MNKKLYWKIRRIIQTFLFKIKSLIYRGLDIAEINYEYKPFWTYVIRKTIVGIIKGLIIAAIFWYLDGLLLKINGIPSVNRSLFLNTIIGGIGVAGVILGLYCANISSIYSLKYASAPKQIAQAFQQDSLIRKCISAIIDYIIFGFIVIIEILIEIHISWIVVAAIAILSIVVVISYSIAGNRAHQLSDIYSVADDAHRTLYRIISKNINKKGFSNDKNFQNHFLIIAQNQIGLLKTVQKYGLGIPSSDQSALVEFLRKNLMIINCYWKKKIFISKESLWFQKQVKYQKWHLTGDTESSLALQTGTSLLPKDEQNYNWLEDELFSINRSCLTYLFEQHDYTSLYTYLNYFNQICATAIKYKESNCFVGHIDWFKKEIETNTVSDQEPEETKKAFAGSLEIISLLYLNLILEAGKYYQEFNIENKFFDVIHSIDSGIDAEKAIPIRGKENIDFYKNIILEVCVEGKRITPDWVIKQQIAKEEYVYINSLIDIVREGMDHAFSLGKVLLEKELYFEACIILTRFYEYESKLSTFLEIANIREKELKSFQVDNGLKWDESRIEKLQKTIAQWKKEVPDLLSKSAGKFTFKNWDNREEYPDFLGESYNHICEDAVEAIVHNDLKQFKIDFNNLTKLMLLYQEYIRTDLNNKDLYRVEYAYYMFTSPIVEWAQIGGLAILWGEFYSCKDWLNGVNESIKTIFYKDGKVTDLPEKLIEYIQHRNRFMFGISNRDVLETQWNMYVANAIREKGNCQSEYGMYGAKLKTDSKLLNAFCSDFPDMGFTNDTAEVFWVVCVNPLLPEDKQIRTRFSWEKKFYE